MKFDIEHVVTIIREVAKDVVLPRWRNLSAGDIHEKTGPDDLVTVADRASEQALSRLLLAEYPDSVVVGEEGVEANPALLGKISEDKPVWIIDPIDGTMAFSKGQEQFDIMVALVQRGEMLGGWIYAPVDDDFYMGEKSAGVWRINKGNKTRLAEISGRPVAELTGVLGKRFFSEAQREALKNHEAKFKRIINTICAGHDYATLLRGDADFAVYRKTMPWDHVPGLMMASELGYGCLHHDGSAYHPWDTEGGLVVGPCGEVEEIRRVLFSA